MPWLRETSCIEDARFFVNKDSISVVAPSDNRQTDPPDFGRAKRVPEWWMRLSVYRRRYRAQKIISESETKSDFVPRKISIVILSCKRLAQLQQLVSGLKEFLEAIETYENIEKILVDNGSGTKLIEWARRVSFFDSIIAHETNLGMAAALNDAFPRAIGEYILLLEEDFIIDYSRPFLQSCIDIFEQYPEIGIIRLKNKRNWGKPFRVIGPLRRTANGDEFWTWLPSLNGKMNVWTAGSVLFRKASFLTTGSVPVGQNVDRAQSLHQGILYEEIYGKRYNKNWLAAKIRNCYPFVQPDNHIESPGWSEHAVHRET